MAELTGKKNLIVEDNKMIRRQLSGMLAKYGAHVIQAEDGEEGYAVALKEAPDVILMDVQMPKMNGYEATRKIKLENTCSEIPIVMLTGNKEDDDIEEGKNCGATKYLTKPVPGAKILETILSLL